MYSFDMSCVTDYDTTNPSLLMVPIMISLFDLHFLLSNIVPWIQGLPSLCCMATIDPTGIERGSLKSIIDPYYDTMLWYGCFWLSQIQHIPFVICHLCVPLVQTKVLVHIFIYGTYLQMCTFYMQVRYLVYMTNLVGIFVLTHIWQ